MDHEHDSADDTRGDCIRRLAEHRDALRQALGGHELHLLITYRDRGTSFGVLFTAQGNVVRVPAAELDPQVELRGTADQVHGFLLGDISLYEAVVDRTVVLHVEPEEVLRYGPVREVVTAALR